MNEEKYTFKENHRITKHIIILLSAGRYEVVLIGKKRRLMMATLLSKGRCLKPLSWVNFMNPSAWRSSQSQSEEFITVEVEKSKYLLQNQVRFCKSFVIIFPNTKSMAMAILSYLKPFQNSHHICEIQPTVCSLHEGNYSNGSPLVIINPIL